MKSNWRRLLAALGLLSAVLAISAVFSIKGPLKDVHWDAPIYLGRAKEFTQAPYLSRYVVEAPAIADRLNHWKIGEDTPYWGFMRLGNTILLGLVTSTLGANVAAIYASFLLYTLLLAAALVSGLLLVLRVDAALGDRSLPRRALIIGTIVSGALYLVSDFYRHLSGNLVAEVPALLLLMLAALALVHATNSRNVWLAICSGALGFALYVIRMEAVWAYLSFILVFAGIRVWHHPQRSTLREAFAAGSTSLLLFLGYAWLFWPLPDPRLLLLFARGVQDAPQSGVSAVRLLAAAGGPLWIGLLLGLLRGRGSPSLWLALIWFFLLLFPHADALLGQRQTETRMYALIMAPLLIASSIGWACAIASSVNRKLDRSVMALMAIAAAVFIAVSQAETYRALRQLPGGWRLQYAREWLSPPSYERLSYPLHDLQEISQFLYAQPKRTVVVPENARLEEHLRIVWYLGPATRGELRPSDGEAEPPAITCRGRALRPSGSHVMFCSEPPVIVGGDADASRIDVLFLRQRSDAALSAESADYKPIFQSRSLELATRVRP